jgi:hypothetical protein
MRLFERSEKEGVKLKTLLVEYFANKKMVLDNNVEFDGFNFPKRI